MEYDIKPTVVRPAQGVRETDQSKNYKVNNGSSKRTTKSEKTKDYIKTLIQRSGCRHQS